MQPEISVVIPTYNRITLLSQTLNKLLQQSLNKDRFEIIVVDDGSEDRTADGLLEIKKLSMRNLKIYRQKNKGSPSARNLGIKEAMGHIIISMDDDMWAYPDLLELHLNFHEKHPEVESAVLGAVKTGNEDADLCDPDNRKMQGVTTSINGDILTHYSNFTTQNVSLKRDFLIEAGLFKEGLQRFDDMELAFRLKDKGLKLYYCPQAISIHKQPLNTLEKVISSGKQYGKVLAEWYDLIPQLRKERTNLGARFDGGWEQFLHYPCGYVKDSIRRWAINKYTIGWIVRIASKSHITNPPDAMLVRYCREIWAYFYRQEFQRKRKEMGNG